MEEKRTSGDYGMLNKRTYILVGKVDRFLYYIKFVFYKHTPFNLPPHVVYGPVQEEKRY